MLMCNNKWRTRLVGTMSEDIDNMSALLLSARLWIACWPLEFLFLSGVFLLFSLTLTVTTWFPKIGNAVESKTLSYSQDARSRQLHTWSHWDRSQSNLTMILPEGAGCGGTNLVLGRYKESVPWGLRSVSLACLDSTRPTEALLQTMKVNRTWRIMKNTYGIIWPLLTHV